MKKYLLVLSFFLFMFSLGLTIRTLREIDKITIVEYNFYAEKNKNNNYITLRYKEVVDEELKRIIKKEKESEDCSFDDLGIPKCVSKEKKNNMIYNKYYIVYYGNDTYKVIYKVKDINYLEKVIK